MIKLQKKICLLGSDGVGKTSIIVRYTKNTFFDSYLMTLGVDFYDIKYGDLGLQVWDLASQTSFNLIREQYLTSTHFAIIVVDIHRSEDEFIIPWIESLKKNAGADCPFIIALNKIDLVEEKEIEESKRDIIDRFGIEVICTSAKSGKNIKILFGKIEKYFK